MKYEEPKLELAEWETDDIIRTSPVKPTIGDNGEDWTTEAP